MENIVVEPVTDAAALEEFIALPKRLYRGHPGYIAPLDMERRDNFNKKKNPYFLHAETMLFLARRNGKAVGRISAQICALYQAKYPDKTGHFGFLDAEHDINVVSALLEAGELWLSARGMRRALGPLSFSTNEETGLLISGFDNQPMIMMPYHPPYLSHLVEDCGYRKAQDLLAYHLHKDNYKPFGTSRMIENLQQEGRLHLRHLEMRHYQRDLSLILDIFNDAWSDNWGMVPFTPEEIHAAADSMRPLIDPRMVLIAEVDGQAAAMLVCLPNLLEAIADLDGKLLLFGWAKLAWRLYRKKMKTSRIPLMGIRKSYHGTLLGASLLSLMFNALKTPFVERGLEHLEMSWILESNLPMRRVLENIGGRVYKTYRVYEKALA